MILATDAMLTNEGLSIQFEQPAKKMTRLSETCVALTAGDALAYTEVFSAVEAEIAKLKAPSVLDVVRKVKQCYQEIRRREIEERLLKPRGFGGFKDFYEAQRALVPDIALAIQSDIERYDYGLQILIGGISGDQAHIYGISDPGSSKCFDAVGFHAIGSGLPHALNTLIAREWHHALPLPEGLLIVYEAKKMAEKAPGVGARITDICIVASRGIRQIPRDKIAGLHEIYEKWVRREGDWQPELDVWLQDIGGPKDERPQRATRETPED